jgi:hypothetical protein
MLLIQSLVWDLFGITTDAGNDNIFSNTINGLISSGNWCNYRQRNCNTSSTTKNVYGNTIYKLCNNTTGSVSGIAVTGGAINNIYIIKFMLFHLQVLESLGQ